MYITAAEVSTKYSQRSEIPRKQLEAKHNKYLISSERIGFAVAEYFLNIGKPQEESRGWGSARDFKYKRREAGDCRKGVRSASGWQGSRARVMWRNK